MELICAFSCLISSNSQLMLGQSVKSLHVWTTLKSFAFLANRGHNQMAATGAIWESNQMAEMGHSGKEWLGVCTQCASWWLWKQKWPLLFLSKWWPHGSITARRAIQEYCTAERPPKRRYVFKVVYGFDQSGDGLRGWTHLTSSLGLVPDWPKWPIWS